MPNLGVSTRKSTHSNQCVYSSVTHIHHISLLPILSVWHRISQISQELKSQGRVECSADSNVSYSDNSVKLMTRMEEICLPMGHIFGTGMQYMFWRIPHRPTQCNSVVLQWNVRISQMYMYTGAYILIEYSWIELATKQQCEESSQIMKAIGYSLSNCWCKCSDSKNTHIRTNHCYRPTWVAFLAK